MSDQMGVAEYRRATKSTDTTMWDSCLASAEGRGATFCAARRQAYDDREDHRSMRFAFPHRSTGLSTRLDGELSHLGPRAAQSCLRPGRGGAQVACRRARPELRHDPCHDAGNRRSGSVSGSFSVGSEAPSRAYQLILNAPWDRNLKNVRASFASRSTKTPEFEVTVSPVKKVIRPGEPISAQVEARYYFGAPVAGGEVSYQIFRQEEQQAYSMPAEYDWLYGPGYGAHSSGQYRDEDQELYGDRIGATGGGGLHRAESVSRKVAPDSMPMARPKSNLIPLP